jgi:hypothetical protein
MNQSIYALTSLGLATLLSSGCSGQSTHQSVDNGIVADLSSGSTLDLASPPDLITAPVSCGNYLYCENFEAYSGTVSNGEKLGPWVATVTSTATDAGAGQTITVDSVRPYSGSKSLHVTVPAGMPTRGTLNQTVKTGLVAGNNIFGRAMVYYSNTNGNDLAIGVHSWIFNANGTVTAGGASADINMGGGGAKFQLNYHPPAPPAPTGTEYSLQGGTQTAGQWMCVQWQLNGSGTTNEGKVWVDGVLALDAVNQNPVWDFAQPWTSMDFGFNHYQTTTNPIDIYLDDFALNDTMIPCPS